MTPYTTTPVVISADAPDEGEMQAVAVMTLRDVFAAFAMQAMVQARCYPTDHEVGTYAYIVADRMLKARAQ